MKRRRARDPDERAIPHANEGRAAGAIVRQVADRGAKSDILSDILPEANREWKTAFRPRFIGAEARVSQFPPVFSPPYPSRDRRLGAGTDGSHGVLDGLRRKQTIGRRGETDAAMTAERVPGEHVVVFLPQPVAIAIR